MNKNLSTEFIEHPIFRELEVCFSAYETLSFLTSSYITVTKQFVGNLDSWFFDSLAGTVESIRTVLLAGRIADAYSLMRRIIDTGHLQLHIMLEVESRQDQFAGSLDIGDIEWNLDDFLRVMEKAMKQDLYIPEIERWIAGEEPIKKKQPSQSGSRTIQDVHSLFDREEFKQILNRCNDHVHINFFRNLRVNAPMDWTTQKNSLEQFAKDFRFLFARNFAYVFTLHSEYMASSDYIDYLECNEEPPEHSQYWVAASVQEAFNLVVTPYRPEVTKFIKQNCEMELD